MIHVITASLGILYLWTLERGCDSHLENSIDDICRKVRDCPPMDNIGAHGDCLKYSIKSMHSLAQSLRAKLTNLSTLKIGHWRDALPIKETRAKIEEDLKNFSEIENYACVLGISNQILQVTNARNIDFLKFLHRVVETMTKILSKKKDYTMFHVCITLTKVVTFVASKPELSESGTDGSSDCEYKGTLLMILSVVLEGKFLSQIQRLHLIDIVKPLLFHKDKVIIHQIIGILGKNSFKASDFRRMVLPHIESTLLALNVKLDHKDYDIEEINGPVWRALSGRIGYDCKVRVQVLFPTFHSISKGSMYNYSEYADENETKYHTTNLETLHSLNSVCHHNICRLIAYQTRPLPYFYITESFQEHDLSKYLLRMRRNQTWLPEDTLVIMTTGLMEAVMYLHSKKIIHRDLTTRTFALKDGDTPVLRDFGIALSDKDGFAIDTTENLIPLRWSPAVSILDDRFDVNTDKYMVGMMIYELFTHGCQPFTELYNMELGKILEMVIFQDLKPRHTPCIPRPIHDLLLKFVSFDGSYTLQDGLQTLEQYLSRSKDRRLRPSDSHGGDWKYPELSKSQEEPERELPEFIKSFKVSGTNPRQMYFNLRASQRKQTAHLACTEADLLSSEDPEIKINSTVVTVVEPVENSFLEEVLPRIIWTELTIHEKPQIERKPYEKQNLIYRLDGVNVIDLALRNTYGDPYDDEPAQCYLQVVIKLVDFVHKMHSSNFVLRDICGKVMYLTKDGNGKVATTRIGRMMYLNPESIDDCLVDRQFTERWNWLPIELIDNSQYSFESDIYMLAMTIHEYYSALDLYRDNPSANRLKCIPFPMVPRDKLRDHLLCGEIPEQSNACSPLLYDILKTCWNRDRTQRPSAASLKTSLINLVDREGARSSQIMEENPDYQFDPPSPCSSTESSMAASFNKYLELKPDDSKNAVVDEDVDDTTKSFRSSLFKRTIKPHIQTNIVRSDQSVKFNPCFDERESLKRDDSQKNVRRSALLNNSVKTSHSRSQSEIDDTNHYFNRTRTERVTFRTNKLVKRLSESSTLKREKLPLDNSHISEICVAPPKLIVREISVDSAGVETDGSSISFANSSSGNTSSGSVLTIANPSSADNTDNNDTDVHSEHELSYISSANYSKVSKDKNPNDDGKVDVQESIYELEDCEPYESLADDKPCSDDNPYLDVVFHHSNQPYHQESTTNADEVSLQDKNDSPESEVKTRHSIDVEIHLNKTDFKDDAVGYQDFDPFYLQQI
ncbi:hypothetical protein FSP39_013447 [Pinctada imbricata]|uniref:Protein kinase domain-containing protein n=1 Tax=Pinctada imbricata TaxID=66713 RepID=A0AA89BT11_PINIB|nr:hypothetical protein FSP39_013447 [Pinctada imbricata]